MARRPQCSPHPILTAVLALLAVLSLFAACGGDDDDSDDGDDHATDADPADDDAAGDDSDDSNDDLDDGGSDDDAADDDGIAPPLCDARGVWRATITRGDSPDVRMILVETMAYDPMFDVYTYEGCSIPEGEYSDGMACPERGYSGEGDGYDFRFVDVKGTTDIWSAWYEGELSTDCDAFAGNWVETWFCCSSIFYPMTADRQ